MKQKVEIGQTDYTVLILIRDTAGAPKTGLVFNSAGIDVCYTRVETDNDVVLTDGAPVDLATPALTDPHLDWGFLQVDAAKAPGVYRLDLPDGVFAAGAWSAVVSLICTGCDPTHIEFMLVPEAPYNTTVPDAAGVAPTAVEIRQEMDANSTRLDADISSRSSHNAAAVKTAIEAGGSHLTLIKAVTDVETGVKAAVNAQNNLSAANVNAEVVDVLKTDTKGEPAQGAPGATLSIEDKIAWMFKLMRNLITNDGNFIKVYNDAGVVVDHKAPVSEAAGTVTRGEFVTGP